MGMRGITTAALFLGLAITARAEAPRLVLTVAKEVHVGDHFEATVDVAAPESDLPVLLTPSEEGDAVTVVRGRLMRSDATDPSAKVLHFRIPLVATASGTAVVRVRLRTFECAARCRPVNDEARALVTVSER